MAISCACPKTARSKKYARILRVEIVEIPHSAAVVVPDDSNGIHSSETHMFLVSCNHQPVRCKESQMKHASAESIE